MEYLIVFIIALGALLIGVLLDLFFACIRIKLKKDVRYNSQYYLVESYNVEEKNAEYRINYRKGKKKKSVKVYLNQEAQILILRFDCQHLNINLLKDEFEFFVNNERTSIKIIEKKSYMDLNKYELFSVIKMNKCYKNGISLIITSIIAKILECI